MPELPPEPIIEPPPKSADKLDIMSRNCSELKATLAVLQGQMNALTAEKTTKETTVTEVTQPKKSKNKKNKANKSCPIKERTADDAKAVNTNGQINSNDEPIEGDVSTNNENVAAESLGENVIKLETDVERVEDPTVSDQSDQKPEEKIEDLVEDLVKDVQTNCTLESHDDTDKISVNVANGFAAPESVESKVIDTAPLAPKLNNVEPVNISSN